MKPKYYEFKKAVLVWNSELRGEMNGKNHGNSLGVRGTDREL